MPDQKPPRTAGDWSIANWSCPDCDHRLFYLGPRGGAARNVECAKCHARFNLTMLPVVITVEPIERTGPREGPFWQREPTVLYRFGEASDAQPG